MIPFPKCAPVTSKKAKRSHYGPLPPHCWQCSRSTIREWTQHSSNCVMVPYTILANQTPTKATLKLPALFTMLPCSSACYTSVHTVHNNNTGHITLHVYLIPCQFLLTLQSQSIYGYIMFCQFLSTTSQHKTNDHLFKLSFIELWSKTCCYQDTTSNHNCCAQTFHVTSEYWNWHRKHDDTLPAPELVPK
jgi:hypothetical protein